MSITFNKAPLIELVAELRWEPQLSVATDQGGNQLQLPRSLLDTSEFEEFFQRFGGAIYQHGFKQMERLVPHGVPLPHDRVACRYRHEDQRNVPLLAQVGPSIFSINALPPYKSWTEFRPWIEKAAGALFEANAGISRLSASVRYIDAFKEPLLQGRSASEFFESELGFALNLPAALTQRKRTDDSVRTAISTSIPLDGMQMTVKLAEGKSAGESVAIMDTLVSVNDEFDPNVAEILQALDSARSVIHDTFIELTQGISELLEPQGKDDD
nr:TIGR04255 family protein [Oceanococcus sp. HetDA_MAG_MS8]